MRKFTKITASLLAGALLLSGALVGCNAANNNSSSNNSATTSAILSQASIGEVKVTSWVDGSPMEMTYKEAPKRVVSMAGFATEILLALGVGDSIVGYAYQDNAVLPQYEAQFSKLKALADDPYTEPSTEITLSVEPDFFISWAGSSTYNYDWCEKNNLMTYGLHCEKVGATIEDTYKDILNLGEIFRVKDKAVAMVDEMRANITKVEDNVKDKKKVSVFVCDVDSSDQAFTAGGGLIADIISKAGGSNIVKNTDKNWTRISWEVVAQANPDWIVIDYYEGFDDIDGVKQMLRTNPATKDLDAVKNNKFLVVGLTDISAGERIDDTIKLMADTFHPEA